MYMYSAIPLWMLILVVGLTIFGVAYKKQYWNYVLLMAYCTLVLSQLVIFRNSGAEAQYILEPFYNYKKEILYGNDREFMGEILLNVAIFIPIGLLAAVKWNAKRSILFGFAFSIIIEFLQLVLRRGFCETDDVIHNTIGCAVGVGGCWAIKRIAKLIKK